MKILILPGFSSHNEIWANDVKENLAGAAIHRWTHWDTGNAYPGWTDDEIKNLNLTEKVDVIAKSIGTLVAMKLIRQINKLILCGIPLNDLSEEDKKQYLVLAHFPTENLLVFQNTSDPHGNFVAAEQFVHGINPQIKILEMPRDDHEYPFVEEFKGF